MKILVIDDAPAKISKIIGVLSEQCGVDRNDIAVAQCAYDARKVLSSSSFDLLIIDILLPLRPEDSPSREISLELLREINEEETLKRPAHILGLTAYSEEANAAEIHFRDRLWTLLTFDESTRDWAKPICNCIEYIRSRARMPQTRSYETDVCLITALEDPEMSAVHRLPWRWEAPTPLDDATFVRRGTITIGSRTFSVVSAVAPRMGMIATTLLASKLISTCTPKIVAMTGVCAGIKDKTNFGDVIFADTSWDWQSGKRIKDKDNSQFAIDPHHISSNDFLRARMQQLRGDHHLLGDIRKSWPNPPTNELRVMIGPMASGSAVLADGLTVQEIKTQQRTLLAVEMEAYGLFAASSNANHPTPLPLVLKSVCDFADPDKKDEMQAYAAYTSASVLKAFLEKYLCETVDWLDKQEQGRF
jgi:nucleoside phosphorylase/CheY-like chemotaxis protein